MATPDDAGELPARVRRLEQDVARLRERVALSSTDASAARVLASGADRDVSDVRAELRAHTMALNALRETQLEQGQRLDRLESRVDTGFAEMDSGFAEMRARFAESDSGFAEMRKGFATIHLGLAQIVAQLRTIEGS